MNVGFHRRYALRAIRLAPECANRRELRDRLAAELPQPSLTRRRVVANKLIQRYVADETGALSLTPSARLLGAIHDQTSQTQLLYYRLTRVDRLVGALAREFVYPYFIDRQVPAGFGRGEFLSLNGQTLLDAAPFLLAATAVEFARRNWDFHCERSVGTAMRILAASGFATRRRLRDLYGRPLALVPTKNDLTLTTFVFALYDTFSDNAQQLTEETVADSSFARTLLAPPDLTRNLLRRARHYGFARRKRVTGEILLAYDSLAAAVDELTERAV